MGIWQQNMPGPVYQDILSFQEQGSLYLFPFTSPHFS